MARPKDGKTAKAIDPHHNRRVNDHDKQVSARLRMIRLASKISQQELGNVLGITFQQVQKYEKGANRITVGRLAQIADALKTTPHELMGWEGKILSTRTVDPEIHKLALAFSDLNPRWRGPLRRLIDALMRDEGKL